MRRHASIDAYNYNSRDSRDSRYHSGIDNQRYNSRSRSPIVGGGVVHKKAAKRSMYDSRHQNSASNNQYSSVDRSRTPKRVPIKQSSNSRMRRSGKSTTPSNPRKILNNYMSREESSIYKSRNRRSSKKRPISKNREMGNSFSKYENKRSGSKKSHKSKNDLLKSYMKTRSPYGKQEDLYQSMDRGHYNSLAKRSKSRPNNDLNFSSLDDRRHQSRNMILESTMERKNLKESIMRRYRDSNTRNEPKKQTTSKQKKRTSMYQNFMNKRVSASKGSRNDMKNWASTDSSAWKRRSKPTKKSELVDKLLNSSYSSQFKTEGGRGMRKAKSGLIYHSHDNDK